MQQQLESAGAASRATQASHDLQVGFPSRLLPSKKVYVCLPGLAFSMCVGASALQENQWASLRASFCANRVGQLHCCTASGESCSPLSHPCAQLCTPLQVGRQHTCVLPTGADCTQGMSERQWSTPSAGWRSGVLRHTHYTALCTLHRTALYCVALDGYITGLHVWACRCETYSSSLTRPERPTESCVQTWQQPGLRANKRLVLHSPTAPHH